MIYGLGMQELLIILAIVMLLFGGKKLPELGKGLGKAIRGFKEAEEETVKELKRAAEGELSDKPKGDGATERKDPGEEKVDEGAGKEAAASEDEPVTETAEAEGESDKAKGDPATELEDTDEAKSDPAT